jgi:hypothetical protein
VRKTDFPKSCEYMLLEYFGILARYWDARFGLDSGRWSIFGPVRGQMDAKWSAYFSASSQSERPIELKKGSQFLGYHPSWRRLSKIQAKLKEASLILSTQPYPEWPVEFLVASRTRRDQLYPGRPADFYLMDILSMMPSPLQAYPSNLSYTFAVNFIF